MGFPIDFYISGEVLRNILIYVGCYHLFFATVEYYTAIFPPDTQSTYAKKVIKALNGKHVKVLEVLGGK